MFSYSANEYRNTAAIISFQDEIIEVQNNISNLATKKNSIQLRIFRAHIIIIILFLIIQPFLKKYLYAE